MQQDKSNTPSASVRLYRSTIDNVVSRTSRQQLVLRSEPDLEVTSPELLRAVLARRVLRRFGAIFRSAGGDAKSFDLSNAVVQISAFSSHAWRTPGWLKTVGLMFHYQCLAGCDRCSDRGAQADGR